MVGRRRWDTFPDGDRCVRASSRARLSNGRRGFAAPAPTAYGGVGPREARAKRAGQVEGVMGAEGQSPFRERAKRASRVGDRR